MDSLFDLMPIPRLYGLSPVGVGVLVGGQVTKYQLSHFVVHTDKFWRDMIGRADIGASRP
jgi:hypothetical protein